MSARVEFSTRAFEASHGRSPRGRGCWGFFFFPSAPRCETSQPDVDQVWWATPGGQTFAEARRAARVEATQRGATFVMVAS